MAKLKIETQISSDDMKNVNEIGGTVWSGVFSVISSLSGGVVGGETFSGEEASKVAGACRKAAERALTKLLSVPVPSTAVGTPGNPTIGTEYPGKDTR